MAARCPDGATTIRKQVAAGKGFLTPRGLDIAETVKDIAAELGLTPPRVALTWTLLNSAVTVRPAVLLSSRTTSAGWTSSSIPHNRPGWIGAWRLRRRRQRGARRVAAREVDALADMPGSPGIWFVAVAPLALGEPWLIRDKLLIRSQ